MLPVARRVQSPMADTWDDPARGTIRWQTLFSAGLTPTNGMVCGVAELVPGEFFAAHHHAEAEIYFGLSGEGAVVIDGTPHPLAPGTAMFIPPDAVHGIPQVTQTLRYFYVFAANSFDDITYRFAHEAMARRPNRPEHETRHP